MSLTIAVTGSTGRMGKAVAALLEQDTTLNSILLSRGDIISKDADIVIDFTSPDASIKYAQQCVAIGAAMVIGTTGFSAAQNQQLKEISQQIPLCIAANFSVGVNLTLMLLKQAATQLSNEAVDIEIIEAHHRHKRDAPSGTALTMGEVIATSLGRDLTECAVYARNKMDSVRDAQSIGFSSIRGGDIIGEHKVIFAMQGERVEISHKASSRDNFARGAIRSACWLETKSKQGATGIYGMDDVLTEKIYNKVDY